MPIDEPLLLERCRRGDLDAFDPLYQEYVTRIYSYLYRRTMDKDTAEDLTSITFMKALEKISSYDSSRGVFAAWLYRIARNSLMDHFRSFRPNQDIEDVWDLASDDDTTKRLKDRENVEAVHEALQHIDPEKREIILLRLWDGLSYKEIAEITGKTESNCKVIFSRTVAELRTKMPTLALLLFLLCPPSIPPLHP
jgi:RNA polymerase sigma-70 factor (ECF subfamily)